VRPRRHRALLCGPSTSPLEATGAGIVNSADSLKGHRYPREGAVTTAAFLCASLVPPIAMTAIDPFNTVRPGQDLVPILMWSGVLYLYTLSFTMLLGLPGFLVVRHFRAVNIWSTSIGGGLVGIAVAALTSTGMSVPFARAFWYAFPLYASLGAISGTIFWALLKYGRWVVEVSRRGL